MILKMKYIPLTEELICFLARMISVKGRKVSDSEKGDLFRKKQQLNNWY